MKPGEYETGRPAPWRTRIVLAGVVWFGVCAVAWLVGMEPRPGLLALVTAAVAGALWLYLDASGQTEPVRWHQPSREPVRTPGEDPRLSLLLRVVSAHLDARETGEQMYRHLAAVSDERLMAHHGITRQANPERAARVLGPELSGLLDGSRTRRLNLAQIERLLDRIETL